MPESEQFVERRKNRRREEDAVVDHAVKDAPIVHRLLQTGKVAAAVASIALVLGGVAGAVGTRVAGPVEDIQALAAATRRADSVTNRRVDVNVESIRELRRSTDSLVQIMSDVRGELRLQNYGQCVLMRKFAPELRAPGCDAAEARAGRLRP